jgi:hypothetical protein
VAAETGSSAAAALAALPAVGNISCKALAPVQQLLGHINAFLHQLMPGLAGVVPHHSFGPAGKESQRGGRGRCSSEYRQSCMTLPRTLF